MRPGQRVNGDHPLALRQRHEDQLRQTLARLLTLSLLSILRARQTPRSSLSNKASIMPESLKKCTTVGPLNRLVRLACMTSISINDSRRNNSNSRSISLVNIRKRCYGTMPRRLPTRWRMDNEPRLMTQAECHMVKHKLEPLNAINRWSADLLTTTSFPLATTDG